jgi:hypothetical protein
MRSARSDAQITARGEARSTKEIRKSETKRGSDARGSERAKHERRMDSIQKLSFAATLWSSHAHSNKDVMAPQIATFAGLQTHSAFQRPPLMLRTAGSGGTPRCQRSDAWRPQQISRACSPWLLWLKRLSIVRQWLGAMIFFKRNENLFLQLQIIKELAIAYDFVGSELLLLSCTHCALNGFS